ncbi:MAG: hypothetical protein EZS28_011078 [Streblomastix strix]|uniref:Peptidase S54 rhomboid domain-containing protein n=1 Tax=Streblomastix strix TaxID=222440 RepID=A0A5J4WGC3_9EUKA|nr:MAG: hypothetical protein EZS28_011078 [Streblomastix strix]
MDQALNNAHQAFKNAATGGALVILLLIVFDLLIPLQGLIAFIPRYLFLDAFNLWALLTGLFYPRNFVLGLVSAIFLFIFGIFFETFWGTRETIRFVLFIGGWTNFIILLIIAIYNLIFSWTFLLDYDFSGVFVIIAAACVALSSSDPDNIIFGNIQLLKWLTNRNLPISCVILFSLLSFVPGLHGLFLCGLIGTISGWVYLLRKARRDGDRQTILPSSFTENPKQIKIGLDDNYDDDAYDTILPFYSLFPLNIQPYVRSFEKSIRRNKIKILKKLGLDESSTDSIINSSSSHQQHEYVELSQLPLPQTIQTPPQHFTQEPASIPFPEAQEKTNSTQPTQQENRDKSPIQFGLSILDAHDQGFSIPPAARLSYEDDE